MIEWEDRPRWHKIIEIMLGSFLGIGLISYLTINTKMPLMVASFGASAVLIYAIPKSPLAQPKNVIGGQMLSAIISCIIAKILGVTWISIGVAVAMSIGLMMLTNTLHPPGGATAIIAVWTQQEIGFVINPILLGSVAMILIAKILALLFSKYIYEQGDKLIKGGRNHEDHHRGA
ncbi:MAG: HPP family protein [Bacillota bacterium]|nr:HPP family protein [Bacillota bacterium]